MKKLLFSFILVSFAVCATAQYYPYPYNPEDDIISESCTSIMVAKGASYDGSVMTAHSCDSNYRTWLSMEKPKTYEGTQPIYWGLLHNEEPYDVRNVVEKGRIPAPLAATHKFLNVAYPCMNEKQLAIGETTTVGRPELRRLDGLFQIEELERIALERCSTAREAIALMGALAQEFGYADEGECLTVADKNEVWHFEIYGNGKLPADEKPKKGKKVKEDKPGALWVAQRIPDDHVGVSANIPRIGVVDFNDPDNFMYAYDLKERSKALGYWSGEGEYKFYKVVSTGKPFSIREFYVLSTMAPSLNLQFDAQELPFSVKPDKKVTVEQMFAYYRETYDGTDFDQVKDLWVEVNRRKKNPDGTVENWKEVVYPISTWMNSDTRDLLNKIKPGVAPKKRTIAGIQCSYSHIMQCRGWLPDQIGGICYFSFDNPAQSPRLPIYIGVTELPESFAVCGQHRYRKDAAVWTYRETNRLATFYWDKTRSLIEDKVAYFEAEMLQENKAIESKVVQLLKEGKKDEATKVLNDYLAKYAAATAQAWEDLRAKIWMFYVRSL